MTLDASGSEIDGRPGGGRERGVCRAALIADGPDGSRRARPVFRGGGQSAGTYPLEHWHEPDRFDKFTERARKVLTLAQEEAQRFNHNYIGTEHLLLGLVREGDGVAAKVLANLGVELQQGSQSPSSSSSAAATEPSRARSA